MAHLAGYLLYTTSNSLRNITKINLQICFPYKTEKEIQILTHDIQQRREFMNMLLLIDLLHHPLKEIELGISGKN